MRRRFSRNDHILSISHATTRLRWNKNLRDRVFSVPPITAIRFPISDMVKKSTISKTLRNINPHENGQLPGGTVLAYKTVYVQGDFYHETDKRTKFFNTVIIISGCFAWNRLFFRSR